MGITRSDLFTQEQNSLALAAKAMAHPARIAIIQHLLKSNTCINSDLVKELGLAQATISQHLSELKEVGLIQGTIEGTRLNYCINPKRWQEVKSRFLDLFGQYNGKFPGTCC
jgi:predicted transcriptional regulator